IEEILRGRRIERFGAVAKALPDEDGARLLRPLVFDRSKPAGGKDAAGQGGNEEVGTDAHGAASYGIATGTGKSGAQSAPIDFSFFSTISFGSPVSGSR